MQEQHTQHRETDTEQTIGSQQTKNNRQEGRTERKNTIQNERQHRTIDNKSNVTKEIQAGRNKDRQTARKNTRQNDRQNNRQNKREKYRNTERQTDRQTDRTNKGNTITKP